jgi:hypothetical protein
LRSIARLLNADVGLIENVVYLGPAGNAAKLQRSAVTLHDSLSSHAQATSATMRPWNWQELSTPNQIMNRLESEWSVSIEAELPHDLFHAGELPVPCTLATQLTLLFGGFEQEIECQQDGRLVARPLESGSLWSAKYPRKSLALTNLPALKRKFPGSVVNQQGTLITVVGPTDLHLELLAYGRAGRPGKNDSQSSPDARWGFQVANVPISQVLDKLAAAIGFQVEWDEACTTAQREQLVSFEVNNATLAEILAELAQIGRLSIRFEAPRAMIAPL